MSRVSRLRPRSLWLGALLALAPSLAVRVARAEPYDAQAKELAAAAMTRDYPVEKYTQGRKKLEKAVAGCKKKRCSSEVQATLHRDLAVVWMALKKSKQSREALTLAVETDPNVQLDPELTTPELEKLFREVGGRTPKKEEPEPEPEVELEEAPAEEAPPAEPPDTAARNWFSLGVQQDLLLHQATSPVCYGPNYTCFATDGSEYSGPIYGGAGNQLAGGLMLATTRVLLGFERVVGDNFLLGVRLGFAFRGAPTNKAGQTFMPWHLELRGGYVFGSAPFESGGLRPYLVVGGGLAEVASNVGVQYFEDQAGYEAGHAGTLDAWRRTGQGFVAPTLGAQYAFGSSALSLEARLLVMLGTSGLAPALGLGYSYGL